MSARTRRLSGEGTRKVRAAKRSERMMKIGLLLFAAVFLSGVCFGELRLRTRLHPAVRRNEAEVRPGASPTSPPTRP